MNQDHELFHLKLQRMEELLRPRWYCTRCNWLRELVFHNYSGSELIRPIKWLPATTSEKKKKKNLVNVACTFTVFVDTVQKKNSFAQRNFIIVQYLLTYYTNNTY